MTSTTTPTAAATGSALVSALEDVYNAIRANHPELPEHVIIVTGSGLTARGAKWGHFGTDRWARTAPVETVNVAGLRQRRRILSTGRIPEMFVAGERLECGAELTVQTMLHECAHALADARGVKDCAASGRHTKVFRQLAEEMGLTYPHTKACPQLGYSAVVLTDDARARYAGVIEALAQRITAHLDTLRRLGLMPATPGPGGASGAPDNGHGTGAIKAPRKGPDRNYIKLVCDCTKPVVIRMAPKVAQAAQVRCEDCGALFHPEGG